MIPSPAVRRALAASAVAVAAAHTAAAQSATPPVHVEVGPYIHALNRGYGTWRGAQARVLYTTPRYTPFLGIASQTRREGSDWSIGAGSYLALGHGATLIVGAGGSPGGDAVLFPDLRVDGSLLLPVPGVPGLLANLGATEFRYDDGGGGTMLSGGPILYHGRGVYSATGRLNHDRLGGAWSGSALLGAMWGTEGRSRVGGDVGWGHQAYAVPGTTPVDARFVSVTATLFAQVWVARHAGVVARYEFEDKRATYLRNGLNLSYFVDF